MVIFGGTGDLTARKLFPAIYNLVKSKLLSSDFAILGVGRNNYSREQYQQIMGDNLDKFATNKVDPELRDWMVQRVFYVGGEFHDPQLYARVGQTLADIDKKLNTQSNYFFYLATSPTFFGEIVDHLGESELACEKDGHWRRVVFEKPFGNDLESAKALNRQVSKVLTERQIFRIDHYLGKETVQNILVFRFSNGIFEPIWNRRYIDHIQITVAETVGVEKRGGYFDMAGTLRDMVPNHLFQLFTLTAMEPPISFDADAVRDGKQDVLRATHHMSPDDAQLSAVRGQYTRGEVLGKPVNDYRAEPNVDPRSQTETYVAMRLWIDNWRWAGVPFYLRTGKSMTKRKTQIAIQFKQAPLTIFRNTGVEKMIPNWLVLNIQPDEGILWEFGAKVPGPHVQLEPVQMRFSYKDFFKVQPSTGYETLIYDAMNGDATLFQRADNIEEGWNVVQPLLDTWKTGRPPLAMYEAGSAGPKAADELLAEDGRAWRPL